MQRNTISSKFLSWSVHFLSAMSIHMLFIEIIHVKIDGCSQILNAEEELKRRSSITQQPGTTASRPSLPLHVDVSNDSGGNAAAHMEGGETNDAGNHNNAQTPSVLRLCGASSSSESPLRRAAAFSQHDMVYIQKLLLAQALVVE